MSTSKTEDRILVIGIGNTLRGDDAAGRIVVEAVASKRLPHVVAISATQLVPEFATLIASSRAVIFIDASVDENRSVEVRELVPACPLSHRFHDTGPRELLALTRNCYGHSPLAWLVTIPARELGLGERLSADAQEQVQAATKEVIQLIEQVTIHEASHA
jgi:hydrogenase maturation protease